MKKLIVYLLLVSTLLSVVFLVSCSKTQNKEEEVTVDEVKIKVFKAGRAACLVLRSGDHTVIVDTATDDKAEKILSYLTEKGITKVDAIVITSLSKKHLGCLPAILNAVSVENVYIPSYDKTSNNVTAMNNALSKANIEAKAIDADETLTFGKMTLDLFAPTKNYATAADINDEGNSVVVGINGGKQKVLYTSRIAGERVTEVIKQLDGKTYDAMIVPNFGIYDTNLPALLEAVKPTYAVVIASANNPVANATAAAVLAGGVSENHFFNTMNGSVEMTLADAFEIKQ